MQVQDPALVVTVSWPMTFRSKTEMLRVKPPEEKGLGGGGGPGGPDDGLLLLLVVMIMLPSFSMSPAFIPAGYSRMPLPPVTCALLIRSEAGPCGIISFISA